MQPAHAELEQLKQRMRSTWMAGDFGQIAQYSAKAAEEFVGRLGIRPAAKVLDGGCGHGTSSIPAARAGAKVTGIDIALNLLEQARQRAVTEGLDATFDEGDAEQLPCADGQFDVVMTMFGAMFAPRPERVAALSWSEPAGSGARSPWLTGRQTALSPRCSQPAHGLSRRRMEFLRRYSGEMKAR